MGAISTATTSQAASAAAALAAPEVSEQIVVIAPSLSIWDLIASADIIGQIVMLILAAASIISWAIIINRYYSYKNIRSKIAAFENIFWSGQVLDTLYDRIRQSVDNPMSSIFVAAMGECKRFSQPATKDASLKVGLKDRIGQAMYLVRNRENEKLEMHLSFLAVVGSTTPFIGVVGTVFGIMHSFQSIAASNNTSLAAVAPGIASALLATAIGLGAAIPAIMAYNLLATQANSISNKMEDFIYELHTLLSRAIDEDKI